MIHEVQMELGTLDAAHSEGDEGARRLAAALQRLTKLRQLSLVLPTNKTGGIRASF